MIFEKLEIEGACLITLEPFEDERGSFTRQFCKNEFLKNGIEFDICQCNISENKKRGTIRGMHYQKEPKPEQKLVSCLRGSIYDVIVDLRKNSSTYLKWIGIELSENESKLLYVPSGVAHGFQTLADNTTVLYELSEFFYSEHYSGVRYDDPSFGIKWQDIRPVIINERDKNYALWEV